MELYVFRTADWDRLYNCTGLDINATALSQSAAAKFIPQSLALIVLCTIYYVLYVPCMFSIWKRHKKTVNTCCYTMLFCIGCFDMSMLVIIGYAHAWFSLQGILFCSHPSLLYWLGIFGTYFWIAESTAAMILALNRCLDIIWPKFTQYLFAGTRVWIWLGLCSLYAFYFAIFTMPPVFSATTFSWNFYPFMGYVRERRDNYASTLSDCHDYINALFMPLTYSIFAIKLRMKFKGNYTNISHAQKMTFLQVFVISLLNFLSTLSYLRGLGIVDQQTFTIFTHFSWVNIHGFPPILFICLNRSIRRDCTLMFYKIFRRNQIGHLHGITIIQSGPTHGNNLNGLSGPYTNSIVQ